MQKRWTEFLFCKAILTSPFQKESTHLSAEWNLGICSKDSDFDLQGRHLEQRFQQREWVWAGLEWVRQAGRHFILSRLVGDHYSSVVRVGVWERLL